MKAGRLGGVPPPGLEGRMFFRAVRTFGWREPTVDSSMASESR